ncbi:hypothetical protein [Rubinisphaera margarita]|uniref:hypothetical protein n=1 Tax=Rubinisphaera margarita TaxID=2909586 RepID=UPI001EE84C9D|nr:hypothetical protein [Rubinisphaera margarita]MCG6156350.1 hypothetical protein [Rubinisphaera margarita]
MIPYRRQFATAGAVVLLSLVGCDLQQNVSPPAIPPRPPKTLAESLEVEAALKQMNVPKATWGTIETDSDKVTFSVNADEETTQLFLLTLAEKIKSNLAETIVSVDGPRTVRLHGTTESYVLDYRVDKETGEIRIHTAFSDGDNGYVCVVELIPDA